MKNNIRPGGYSQASGVGIYNEFVKDQYYGKLIQLYNESQLLLTQFLYAAGQRMNIKGNTIDVISQGTMTSTVVVSMTTSTGGVTTVTPETEVDYGLLRESYSLIVPSSQVNDTVDAMLRLTKDANGTTFTGRFLKAGVEITTAITNMEMIFGPTSFPHGGNQPTAQARGYFKETYYTSQVKGTVALEGGMQFQEMVEPIQDDFGNNYLTGKMFIEGDFDLDTQMDAQIFAGQRNTNNVKAPTEMSGDVDVLSGDGLIEVMEAQSLKLPYTENFDMDSFRAVQLLNESVGNGAVQAMNFLQGNNLNRNITDNMMQFLDDWSAGHTFYSAADAEVGFACRKVNIYNQNFRLTTLSSLSNPLKYGNANYAYKNMGMIFPDKKYSVSAGTPGATQDVTVGNMTLGMVNNNGEDRWTRKWISRPGANGQVENFATSEWDNNKWYSSCNFGLIFTGMEQAIKIDEKLI